MYAAHYRTRLLICNSPHVICGYRPIYAASYLCKIIIKNLTIKKVRCVRPIPSRPHPWAGREAG